MEKYKLDNSFSISYLTVQYSTLIVAIAASFVYSGAIFSEFVYDDRPAILNNEDVIGQSTWLSIFENDFWGNPIKMKGSHKSYRPLITISFRIQYILHGFNPSLYHLINVCIHVINSILVLKLAKLQLRNEFAIFSAILFSIHPITTEAVCSIVGRSDLLATTFTLLSILRYIKYQDTISCISLSICGILSKETSIIILPILIFYDILFIRNKMSMKRMTELSVAFVIICYIRLFINGFQSPTFSRNDNPIAHHESFYIRSLNFFYLPIFHLSLMVFPNTLSFDWSMNSIPLIESIFDSRFIFAAISYSILSMIVYQLTIRSFYNECMESSKLLFIISIMILPHLISSNIFTYVGFVAAERILYLPSVGYSILIGYCIEYLRQRYSSSSIIKILVVILILHSFRTIRRTNDWKNERLLFESALDINPIKANANLGHVYAAEKQFEKARECYMAALERQPNMADTWYNLGILATQTNNHSRAIEYYQQSIKYRSNFAAAYLNMALIQWDMKQYQQSFDTLDGCLKCSADNLKSYKNHMKMRATCAFNKGRLLQQTGKYQRAIEYYYKALNTAPKSFDSFPSVFNSLGSCYLQMGNMDKAEEYYQKAMNYNYINSYLTMAHLKIQQNRSIEADDLITKVIDMGHESTTVLQNIALAEHKMKHFNRSYSFYSRALHQNPNHIESITGMANLLRETEQHEESEEYYRRIVELRPYSHESYANYGAILHSNRKYEMALKYYDRAIDMNPMDNVTKENRNKLMRLMRRERNV